MAKFRLFWHKAGVRTCFATLLAVTAVPAWATLLFLGRVPWPFPLRPSLVVLGDPELRRDVGLAALAIAGGLLAAGLGLSLRRLRWAGLLVLAAAGVYAEPSLRYLLVDAYPTSYYRSPTAFASTSIAHGRALYAQSCAACHGDGGRGDGPLAYALADPPVDLTAAHLWDHGDGEMFWWLTHGIDGPEGGLVMPAFAASLSVADRWDLIDYVRAHNAGVSMRMSGGWSHPVAMPGFVARCGNKTVASADLRGRVVRLMVAPGEAKPAPLPPAQAGIEIVDVYAPTKPAGLEGCVADAPTLVDALATVTGSRSDAMSGAQFLVDPDGVLRARHVAGQADGWNDTVTLLAQVGQICTHPAVPSGGDDAQAP